MNHSKTNTVTLLLILLYFTLLSTVSNGVSLIHSGESKCLIILAPESKLAMRAAKRLQTFIEKTSGKAPKIEEKTVLGNE